MNTHVFVTHASVEFRQITVLTIVNRTVMAWVCGVECPVFDHIPRSGIAGSCGRSIFFFTFLRILHTYCHNNGTSFKPHQQ